MAEIISPYRVAPAQGGFDDIMRFLGYQQDVANAQEQARLLQATRGYLGQQAGLPQGVDPMAVQTYQSNAIDQRIKSETADRAGQEWQHKLDFANQFMGNLPPEAVGDDPYLRALAAAGGNLYGADSMNQALGGRFARTGELDNRRLMNQDDNQAAAERLAMELASKGEQVKQELDLKQQAINDQVQRTAAAYARGATTGDWGEYNALVSNRLSHDEQLSVHDLTKQRLEQERMAQEREKYKPTGGSSTSKSKPKQKVAAKDQGATFFAAPPPKAAPLSNVGPALQSFNLYDWIERNIIGR